MIGPYWTGDTPTEPVEVTVTRDGYAVDLSVYESARVELTRPDGSSAPTEKVGVTLDASKVVVSWPADSSLFTVAGRWTLQVILVAAGTVGERVALLPFDVRSTALAAGTEWCTPVDVLKLTGKVVDNDDVERAAGVIDTLTGAGDLDVATMRGRDRRALRNATAYQTAWMVGQFDTFERHDVTSMSSEQGSFSPRDVVSMVLAPLAKQALRRTSWSGDRTTSVGPNYGSGYRVIDPVISDAHPWYS